MMRFALPLCGIFLLGVAACEQHTTSPARLLALSPGNAPVTSTSLTDVTIDPGQYTGDWSIAGVTASLRGLQSVHLDPGLYYMRVELTTSSST